MTIVVRAVSQQELDEVGRITAAAYRALPGPPVSPEYLAVVGDARGRADEAPILVAADGVDGGGVVGAVTYVPDHANPHAEHLRPGESSMRYLAVDPAAQRRGAARALVQACIDRSVAAGCDRVFLHSSEHMNAAHRLYEGMGFQRVAERDWPVLSDLLLYGYALDLRT